MPRESLVQVRRESGGSDSFAPQPLPTEASRRGRRVKKADRRKSVAMRHAPIFAPTAMPYLQPQFNPLQRPFYTPVRSHVLTDGSIEIPPAVSNTMPYGTSHVSSVERLAEPLALATVRRSATPGSSRQHRRPVFKKPVILPPCDAAGTMPFEFREFPAPELLVGAVVRPGTGVYNRPHRAHCSSCHAAARHREQQARAAVEHRELHQREEMVAEEAANRRDAYRLHRDSLSPPPSAVIDEAGGGAARRPAAGASSLQVSTAIAIATEEYVARRALLKHAFSTFRAIQQCHVADAAAPSPNDETDDKDDVRRTASSQSLRQTKTSGKASVAPSDSNTERMEEDIAIVRRRARGGSSQRRRRKSLAFRVRSMVRTLEEEERVESEARAAWELQQEDQLFTTACVIASEEGRGRVQIAVTEQHGTLRLLLLEREEREAARLATQRRIYAVVTEQRLRTEADEADARETVDSDEAASRLSILERAEAFAAEQRDRTQRRKRREFERRELIGRAYKTATITREFYGLLLKPVVTTLEAQDRRDILADEAAKRSRVAERITVARAGLLRL